MLYFGGKKHCRIECYNYFMFFSFRNIAYYYFLCHCSIDCNYGNNNNITISCTEYRRYRNTIEAKATGLSCRTDIGISITSTARTNQLSLNLQSTCSYVHTMACNTIIPLEYTVYILCSDQVCFEF